MRSSMWAPANDLADGGPGTVVSTAVALVVKASSVRVRKSDGSSPAQPRSRCTKSACRVSIRASNRLCTSQARATGLAIPTGSSMFTRPKWLPWRAAPRRMPRSGVGISTRISVLRGSWPFALSCAPSAEATHETSTALTEQPKACATRRTWPCDSASPQATTFRRPGLTLNGVWASSGRSANRIASLPRTMATRASLLTRAAGVVGSWGSSSDLAPPPTAAWASESILRKSSSRLTGEF